MAAWTKVDRTASHLHITRNPAISGGEPIIAGTRIPVQHIVERLQAGQSVQDIKAALPHLTAMQVQGALSYYRDHRQEIDRLIEASRPERVAAALGLEIDLVGDGIAVARSNEQR